MTSLEAFDKEVKDMVDTKGLTTSRIQKITSAAMDNIASDAHMVATLFKVHKQAKGSHKLTSLYIVDAICREAKQRIRKSKAKGKSDADDADDVDSDDVSSSNKPRRGTYASFLAKIEPFIDRLVTEVVTKGPPEHKEKVRKVLDIWTKSSTFSPSSLKSSYAKLEGKSAPAGQSPAGDLSSSKKDKSAAEYSRTTIRSTTPPYPPPDPPIKFPSFPASWTSQLPAPAVVPVAQQAALPFTGVDQLASLLALQQQATTSNGFPSGPPHPPPAQAVPAPAAFQIDQLALLQQLAAQTSNAGFSTPPTAPTSAPALAPPPTSSSSVPSAQPGQAIPAFGGMPPANGVAVPSGSQPMETRPQRPRSPISTASNPRTSFDRTDRNSRRNGRSRSPEFRRREPPAQSRGRDGPTPQQQGGRIATFISEDRDDEPGGRFGHKKQKLAMARQDVEEDDMSAFTVNTTESHQQDNLNGPTHARQGPGQTDQGVAKPFDYSTFNPMNPESWAGFAEHCANMLGYMPSNQQMVMWIMQNMAMMQAGQQMGGMGQSQADMNSTSQSSSTPIQLPKGPKAMRSKEEQVTVAQDGQADPARKRKSRWDQPAKDEGEGEADMDFGDDT